ncbi:MAG: hypothetical protein N2645_09670 [Clostridia bacterium]|nr:hypothetical protein [Clostridia bacterium]
MKLNFEKLKFFILIILVVSSLIQVGILWGYQNHGLPINFLSVFFQTDGSAHAGADIERDKDLYFIPNRMVLSDGSLTQQHWLIGMKNTHYQKLWEESKGYIRSIFKSSSKQIIPPTTIDEDTWGKIVSSKPIMIEFKTGINPEIIKWFLGMTGSESDIHPSSELPAIEKLLISPSDEDFSGQNVVFIREGNNLYTYAVEPPENLTVLNAGGLKELFRTLLEDTTLNSYSITKEMSPVNQKNKLSIAQDILAISPATRYRDLYSIGSALPEIITMTDYDKIGDMLLGRESSSYTPDLDKNGSALFKKTNNIYRLYKDGVMEYKYLEKQDISNSLNLTTAFENAMKFINEKRGLVRDVNIFLSGIEARKDSYIFTFDYSLSFEDEIAEIPIIFENYKVLENEKQLGNAITINANSKRVLECLWIIRNFEKSAEPRKYDIGYFNFLENAFSINKDLKNKESNISEINICYKITNDNSKNASIIPEWQVASSLGDFYVPFQSINN